MRFRMYRGARSTFTKLVCSLTEVYFLGFSWRSKRKGSRKAQKACVVSVAWAPGGDAFGFFFPKTCFVVGSCNVFYSA